MEALPRRALLVDDEPMVRALLMRAFRAEGFDTDVAVDGCEACSLLENQRYDVVVTDLRMPRKHGHALVCEMLKQDPRPRIIVLTAVSEPRLAKDLLVRGVDDVVIKPIDFPTFATKIRVMLDRSGPNTLPMGGEEESPCDIDLPAIGRQEFDAAVESVAEKIPVAPSTLSVYEMANSDQFDTRDVSETIAGHDVLKNEVIQLANTPFYNRKGKSIDEVGQAVVRLGKKRVGQLAIGANAIAAVSPEDLSWMDLSGFWRHSVASGLAVELLIHEGQHQEVSEGLLACATLQGFGKIVLGSLFPDHYRHVVEMVANQQGVLDHYETQVFPVLPTECMLNVLESWGIPAKSHQALQFVHLPFADLESLKEPLRTQCRLIKLAGLCAHIALGYWEPWTTIDIPDRRTLETLRIFELDTLLHELERNVAGINSFQVGRSKPNESKLKFPGVMGYCRLRREPNDVFWHVLTSLGVHAEVIEAARFPNEHVVVNCLESDAAELTQWLYAQETKNVLAVTKASDIEECRQISNAATVPLSVAALRAALGLAASTEDSVPTSC